MKFSGISRVLKQRVRNEFTRPMSTIPARKVVKEVDYLILGAGSAGSVLARRLVEGNPSATVAVVEAGRSDTGRLDSWQIQMPSALTYSVAGTKNNWDYYTVPQKGLAGRSVHQPRGKVFGGSSSINAMVYVRGHAEDFNRWANEGAGEDWSYKHVLPYFKRAQKHAAGGDEFRGSDGPLHVKSYNPTTYTNELFGVLVDAGKEAGYLESEDTNGQIQEGFGPFDMTVSPNGVRCSTAEAFLRPALKVGGDRISIHGQMLVERITFDDENAATGIEAIDMKASERVSFKAKREVISCLGAIGSPQILMLSGIGDQHHLKEVGVNKVRHDNPAVGANLQDHLEVYLQYLCTQPVTLYPIGNWTLRYLHRRVAVGLEWFLMGSGVAASNQFESGAFIRSRAGVQHPDIQYHFIPGCVLGQLEFLPHHGFQIHVGTLRPLSRGTVRLRSSDPQDSPLIDPAYLENEKDLDDMRNAVRLADEIIQQPAFDQYRGRRLAPVPEVEIGNDDSVDEWIRTSSHSAYHPSCTCAMGSVVDSQGRVFGVSNLRVVDASIMPSMTSGNLNAPTIMIAEKISDAILGLEPLPPTDIRVVTDVEQLKQDRSALYDMPNWQTKQRQEKPVRATSGIE